MQGGFPNTGGLCGAPQDLSQRIRMPKPPNRCACTTYPFHSARPAEHTETSDRLACAPTSKGSLSVRYGFRTPGRLESPRALSGRQHQEPRHPSTTRPRLRRDPWSPGIATAGPATPRTPQGVRSAARPAAYAPCECPLPGERRSLWHVARCHPPASVAHRLGLPTTRSSWPDDSLARAHRSGPFA